jgi:hypothetical protein
MTPSASHPVSSHFWKSYQTVVLRLVSKRGPQKPSVTLTAVKGAGRYGLVTRLAGGRHNRREQADEPNQHDTN